MTSALPRRTAAVTALTVAAFSGAAVVATAGSASAAPKLHSHTTLSIRAQRAVINPGGGTIVSGQLRSRHGAAKHHRVTLMDKPAGADAWAKDKVRLTHHDGVVRFRVAPSATTAYQLVFKGNKKQHASHSGVVVLRVADTTSLVASVGTKSVAPGTADSVTGVLSLDSAPLVAETVVLHAKTRHHTWAKAGSAMTGEGGSVTFAVTPAVSTRYRLSFAKTEADKGALSAPTAIFVTAPSSLSIRARFAKKAGVEVITGDLRGGGHNLPGRKVTLQERAAGGTSWTTVTTKHTHRHGVATFTLSALTTSEDFQLVYSGGPRFDGCQSGVVTVTVN